MKLYMRTTMDEYELPVAVAENARELARMIGTSEDVVFSSISHKKRGWYKIEVPDEKSGALRGRVKGVN